MAVSPILEELRYIKVHFNEYWPRIGWISSGSLNILPIHMAGYYGSGSIRNSIDRVISSYTPIIKALLYARERNREVGRLDAQKAMLM